MAEVVDKLSDGYERADRRPRGSGVMGRKLIGVLLAILSVMLLADAAAATPAGTVVVASGLCTDNGSVLKSGDAVQISDTVDVPTGNLKLQMVDGSVISVAPGSSMTVASYNIGASGRNVRLWLTRGLLRAQVPSAIGPSTFEVSTAGGTASVASDSADWFIKAQTGSAQVGVLTGTVDLTSTVTEQAVSIPTRWGTRLESGLDPVLPRVWTQREFTGVIRLTDVPSGGQGPSPSNIDPINLSPR
jgi:FecR protein